MKFLISTAVVLLSMATSSAFAARVTYVFDTVNSVSLELDRPEIRGTAKDTGAPLQVPWDDNYRGDSRFQATCVPLFLTMLEKPGRYFLYVTIDAPEFESRLYLRGCRLDLRS